ncbi:hypothetical protein [Salinisphaera sp.]|uniref:hypothetical protein n=1 Tax=Salinisphaera sp. TaxID=1914330 RepID=UPI002D764B00|nr:hypothetical protein [Salinisphaera sp.]HET7313429.1 hypothetical protein [Salinisphaera sp.]
MTIKTTAITGLTAITLAAGSGVAFAADSDQPSSASQTAISQAQGMYSADQLLDADVYAEGNSKDAIGEVDDVLLGNGMQIRSFVIETNGKLGLGGKSYVVSPNRLTVQTLPTDEAKEPNYRINLDMSRDELADQPLYSDSWWTNAQSQAAEAWQSTKHSASSAWTQVKQTTSNLFGGAKDTAGDAADTTSDAAQNAGDATSDAIDNATDN